SARSMRPEIGDAGAASALRSALADYGVDVAGASDPSAAVRPLASRPEAVRVAAAAGLDEGGVLAPAGPSQGPDEAWRRPAALAEALDPEPSRLAVRRAWADRNEQALRRLATPEAAGEIQPAALALLAEALADTAAGRELAGAVAVLRRGLLRHPRD